eukprot:TRINITY_DN27944_c0_g1_i1.p1 TRINITY_DN27944_c0_g1~~TRINITY_DN27944_c0_g1_i1.p1  ORF type:complete len:739 (+),score=93.07 TRINITY_DN27944_c0_g1_i1:180-2219(+)
MFPDFEYVAEGNLTDKIDAVLITHFHLDHVGSLPVLTERVGYSGPLIMSAPTKSISPLLLNDFAKIQAQRTSTTAWDPGDVEKCMSKASTIEVHETITLVSKTGTEIKITAYYAGHVLGAVMFLIEANGTSVLYTGDYNTSSDRHLAASYVPPGVRPDVLITESTYGNKIRDSRRARERVFLETVFDTVTKGGKVLIPVFAMGRAQELLLLIETYWKRMQLSHIPIYFSAGMVGRANDYYKLHTSWTSPAFKNPAGRCSSSNGNSFANFDFSDVSVFHDSLLSHPGPLVLFSTPGMLHAGSSLKAFHHWCGSDLNTVILPGFCVPGTLGHEVLTNESPTVTIDDKEVRVKCRALNMPFSAHADARGILRLVQQLSPQTVVLVHGDYERCMLPLIERVTVDCKISCYAPANGQSQSIILNKPIPVIKTVSHSDLARKPDLTKSLLDLHDFAAECEKQLSQQQHQQEDISDGDGNVVKRPKDWWSSWGLNIDKLSMKVADLKPIGPCDVDCGCETDWASLVANSITKSSPASRYVPIPNGTQKWGTDDCEKLLVSVGENSNTFELSTPTDFIKAHGLSDQKHQITFTALIHRSPSCTLPPPSDTASVLTAVARLVGPELDSLPAPQTETLQLTSTSVTYKSIIITAITEGDGGIQLKWQGGDLRLAVRLHEVISDTLGVAL